MKQFTEKIDDKLLNVLIGHGFPYCESATCADVLDWIIDAGFDINVFNNDASSNYVFIIMRANNESLDIMHRDFQGNLLKDCIEQAIIELVPIFEH